MNTRKKQQDASIHSALEKSARLSADILSRCLVQNSDYFRVNSQLLTKVQERLQRGQELSRSGNYRVASIVQRHAIDLILQENHKLFKDDESLRKALLAYRDHYDHSVLPLAEQSNSGVS
ncbi:hypothetical protein H2508_05030 [Parahaliea sp. F7430]|uniref:Uncharacterized protein n=1 Tax=Sediminihaliea albiluteola TaxID=2758564 RepID=A0A7W2TV63_9GAMM|nr:hypothetical protein [Sediminihaliea albiluteola]MBA6412468.1 hypothetical protein [Sediminihaliea albiluteola]